MVHLRRLLIGSSPDTRRCLLHVDHVVPARRTLIACEAVPTNRDTTPSRPGLTTWTSRKPLCRTREDASFVRARIQCCGWPRHVWTAPFRHGQSVPLHLLHLLPQFQRYFHRCYGLPYCARVFRRVWMSRNMSKYDMASTEETYKTHDGRGRTSQAHSARNTCQQRNMVSMRRLLSFATLVAAASALSIRQSCTMILHPVAY